MRARNIKPGFFQNEDLAELPPEARLLFIGLWLMADREGRLEDRPKRIKMQVFPADDWNIDALLESLHDARLIIRYVVNDCKYIEIPKFLEHQRPHHQEKPSLIPERVRTKERSGSHQGTSQSALNPDTGYLNDDSLNPEDPPPVEGLDAEAWERFRDYRKKIRKPIKPASLLAAQQQLAGFGCDQAAVVQRSIANSWTGLFPLKDGGTSPGQPPRKTKFEELYGAEQ